MSKFIFLPLLVFSFFANAGLPVMPAKDQQALLKSADPQLAANKKLVYDFTRIVLNGLHLDQAATFLRVDYIQHNPNVETGLQGFLDAFSQEGPPQDIPAEVPDLVSIQAEGDLVTFSFVTEAKDSKGQVYTSTWFDMFRVQDGKIAEHWDPARKPK